MRMRPEGNIELRFGYGFDVWSTVVRVLKGRREDYGILTVSIDCFVRKIFTMRLKDGHDQISVIYWYIVTIVYGS